MKKVLLGIFIPTLIIVSIILGVKYMNIRNINTAQIDVLKYIEYADKLGEGKIQLNWKQMVAILAVEKKNKLDEVTDEEIEKAGEMFIEKSNGTYKLKSLERVLNELEFSKKEVKWVYKYLEQLKYFGVVPTSVNKESEQMIFIDSIKQDAIENYNNYSILSSITIAQAILESDFGRSELATQGNNLFGIKADSNYKGEKIKFETKEYHDIVIQDDFRKYDDVKQSIDDHGRFLYENERYKENGLFEGNTYIQQAKALEDAGYSTAENENGEKVYAKTLIQLIREYNLQLIDSNLQQEN